MACNIGVRLKPKLCLTLPLPVKSLLSTLKDEEAVRIVSQWNIEQAREYGGPNGITTIKGLLGDLEKIRKDKYAMVIEEAEVGVCAAAVGVYDTSAENKLLGTLSIAGPTARLNKIGLKSKIPDMKKSADIIQEGWNLWASSKLR